jgi:LruC domain-containing protein
MKTQHFILVILIISLFASSCKKETTTDNEDPIIESFNDLIVPADFDWKTTKTITVSVNLPNSGEIQPLIITNRAGTKKYFRGYPEDNSRTINTIVTIPSYLNELKLIYNGTVGPNIVYVSNEYLAFDYNNTPTEKSTETFCGECEGQITILELEYVGAETSPDIIVTQHKSGGSNNHEIFNEDDVSDPFEFSGVNNHNKMGAKIKVYVNGVENVEMHTSCSVTFLAGMTFGDFKIISGESDVGGELCEVDDDCGLIGFETFTKEQWGKKAKDNNAGQIRDDYFDAVYPTDFVVGNPDEHTIIFNESKNVKKYLPGGGSAKVLLKDWENPGKNDELGNMADQIIAARLNRDFDFAEKIGSNENYDLGELVFVGTPFANMTVDEFLNEAEYALGGGGLNNHTAGDYADAAEAICTSFDSGNSGVLTCPSDPELNDPLIEVFSTCNGQDILFEIVNNGDGDMTNEKDYTLYKNDEEIDNGTYKLDVNQTLDISTTGFNTDEFKLVVEIPEGDDLSEEISGCVDEDNPNPPSDQLEGTLAYEDLWPGKGDYDFNDLVVDYDFQIEKDEDEFVQTITAIFTVKAFGASLHNGFGFTLPTVSPGDITSVSGYDVINSTVFDIAGNGLENGQSKATIIVFDDVRRVMPQTTGGIGVNTQLEYAYTEPVSIAVVITFANEAVTYSELNIGTFNPFLVVNTIINGVPGERGHEIHLPYYEPSDLFDDTYFGQSEDDSSVNGPKYFVTSNNLPWAINIAEEFDWVIEFQDITGAYTNFAEWAQSGGDNSDDWYKDYNGYRNDNLIYPTQIGN